jgi:ketosteroid isomerase-like protein
MRLVRAFFVALFVVAAGSAAMAQMASPPPPDPAIAALPAKMAAALIANDSATLRANCAASATVVDEFPPYAWNGPGACVKWAAGFKAFAAQVKLTHPKATIKPKPFVDMSGTAAYMTAQMRFEGVLAGKPFSEEGTWTFVLVKSGAGWKITHQVFGVLHH